MTNPTLLPAQHEPDTYPPDTQADCLSDFNRPLWLLMPPREVAAQASMLLEACAARLRTADKAGALRSLASNLARGRQWTDIELRAIAGATGDLRVRDTLVAVSAAMRDGEARAYVLARLVATQAIDRQQGRMLFLDWSEGAFERLTPFARLGLLEAWLKGGGRASARLGPAPDREAPESGPVSVIVAPGLKAHDPPQRSHGRLGPTEPDTDLITQRFAPLGRPMPIAGDLTAGPDGRFLFAQALSEEFPWFESVIASIDLHLRLPFSLGRSGLMLPPLLLIGPPGCGKTRFAQRLAHHAGTGFGALSAAGSSDARLLLGTARGYATSQPCWPAHVMLESRTANPVLLVDEIDRETEERRNGRISDSLLGMIEPQTARAWPDECLMTPLDLSAVTWVLTANSTRGLDEALLSRLDIHIIPQPTGAHFDAICSGVLSDIARQYRTQPENLPRIDAVRMARLRQAFAADPSARRLAAAIRRELGHALLPTDGPLQ